MVYALEWSLIMKTDDNTQSLMFSNCKQEHSREKNPHFLRTFASKPKLIEVFSARTAEIVHVLNIRCYEAKKLRFLPSLSDFWTVRTGKPKMHEEKWDRSSFFDSNKFFKNFCYASLLCHIWKMELSVKQLL